MKKISILILILFLACLGGCSDEETVEPENNEFSVNLKVTDPDGDPVEGLEATLHVFIPQWLVPGQAKPAVVIPFYLPIASHVSLVVYDLDGNVVKTLVNETLTEGSRQVVLAVDDAGNSLIGTHLYRCELVATLEGAVQFRGETFVTLYTGIDAQQRPLLGTTNSQGRVTFKKRTEFPYLYNPGPQTAMDEDGEARGTFEFIDQVEITLRDTDAGLYLTLPVDIGDGPNALNLVWDEALAIKAETSADSRPAPRIEAVSEAMASGADVEYSVGPAYPNPFN